MVFIGLIWMYILYKFVGGLQKIAGCKDQKHRPGERSAQLRAQRSLKPYKWIKFKL